MHASKCNYYEISVKIIRMLEKFSWSAKSLKHAGFWLRMGLNATSFTTGAKLSVKSTPGVLGPSFCFDFGCDCF